MSHAEWTVGWSEGWDKGYDSRKATVLAALRAELPTLSCYEPSRMIGSPCSCAAGLLRAIEIVEATQ